jgi:hypothetical protein
MKRLSCPASLFGLLLCAMLGIAGGGPALAAQSDQSVEIEFIVNPPPESEVDPNAPRDGSGTVTTGLTAADPLPPTYAAEGFLLTLLVADARAEGDGWEVSVMQMPAGADDPLLLHHYPYIPTARNGTGSQAIGAAPVTQLSIGQPLDRLTPVSLADSGIGPGTYGIQFVVACDVDQAESGVALVLSLTAAP